MKTYTVCQRVYCYDTFDESDIPEGLTPIEYAEQRYEEELGDPDSHELYLIGEDEDGRVFMSIDTADMEED
jgi:hypothetical protein